MKTKALCCLWLSPTARAQTPAAAQSAYTELTAKACTRVQVQEEAYTEYRCPSLGAYRLSYLAGERDGLLLSHQGRQLHYEAGHGLGSGLGSKAEWRYRQQGSQRQYHALIVRVLTPAMNPQTGMFDHRAAPASYLAVIRLQGARSCLLGRIQAAGDMNQQARALADNVQAACIR